MYLRFICSHKHTHLHTHITNENEMMNEMFCDDERNESNEINARRFVKEKYILNTESSVSPYTKEQRNQKLKNKIIIFVL